MEHFDDSQKPGNKKEKNPEAQSWKKFEPVILAGAIVILVLSTVGFVDRPAYEALTGIIAAILAFLSINTIKNKKINWILAGVLVVTAVGGLMIVIRENDPEKIVIVGIFYDGVQAQESDEFVAIRNEDTEGIQLKDWTLNDDQSNHVFTFPRYEIQPGEECRIYTNEYHAEWCGFNFGSGGSGVWNNDGDIATLRNAQGELIDESTDPIEPPEVVRLPAEIKSISTPTLPAGYVELETPPANPVDRGAVPSGIVVITDVFYDGAKSKKEPDEYVEIRNDRDEPIQLDGWTLCDSSDHRFIFPTFVIEPGQSCRIYTDEDHSESCGFNYENKESAIWGNAGDCATLTDREGSLVDEYCY